MNAALVALIREYTEHGRLEAMARTLDDIHNLPETRPEAAIGSETTE
jgi:hypothetical protein